VLILATSVHKRPVPDQAPGYHSFKLNMPSTGQEWVVRLWYPTDVTTPPSLIAQNALFYGFYAIPDAAHRPGAMPLILLSHGSGGNAPSLGWLAAALAQSGFIVAAPNHSGTTSRDSDPFQTVKVWERPVHLRALLDHMASAPPLTWPPISTGSAPWVFRWAVIRPCRCRVFGSANRGSSTIAPPIPTRSTVAG